MTQLQRNLFRALFLAGILLLVGCSSAEPPESTAPVDVETQPTLTAEGETEPTAPSGALAILPTPAPGTPELTANQNVNLRSGPGQNYPVLAILEGGVKATLLGISPDGTYYAVSLPVAASGTGWVDAKFSQVANAGELAMIQPPPVPPTADFIGPQPGDPQVTASDVVYVRTGPGDQYPAYGIVPAGGKGLAFGRSEDGQWWAVRINPEIVGKGHGWVATAFVQAENVEDLPIVLAPKPVAEISPQPPAEGEPRATATEYVNVRTGPGMNYPVLGMASPGDSATVSGRSTDGQWWQVVVETDFAPEGFAWVHAGFVSTENTDSIPVVEAPPAPPAPSAPPSGNGSGLYACVVISQSPADGTTLAPGDKFSMVWEVQNTGEEVWSASDAKAVWVAAANDVRLSSVGQINLDSDIPVGGTFQLNVPMKAPDSAGQYGETWNIVQGDSTLCQVWNIIQVKQ